MTSEDVERCPGCGEPWENVPLGHSVAYPLNGDKPTCSDISRPVSPEEFMAGPERNADQ